MFDTTELMISPEFIGVISGVIIGGLGWITGYLVYSHERRKTFQEILYQRKMDAYQEILGRCYKTSKRLDLNSKPYSKIYDYKDKSSWEAHWMTVNGAEYEASFKLQDLLHRHAHLLPKSVIDTFQVFVDRSIQFVTVTTHFDTEILIDYMDKLWGEYNALSESIRSDLHVEVIGRQLQRRIAK